MLSETLADSLETYRIGPKIHRLRLDKDLALAQLGDHTGLSAGMLSKIERGLVVPTLPTLMRIAMVFGVGLDHFFTSGEDQPTCAHVPKGTRIKLPIMVADRLAYHFESLDFPVTSQKMEAYLAEFPAGAPPSDPHKHPGLELVFVLSGTLGVLIHGRTRVLETEDTLCFDAGFNHRYENLGPATTRAIVVVVN